MNINGVVKNNLSLKLTGVACSLLADSTAPPLLWCRAERVPESPVETCRADWQKTPRRRTPVTASASRPNPAEHGPTAIRFSPNLIYSIQLRHSSGNYNNQLYSLKKNSDCSKINKNIHTCHVKYNEIGTVTLVKRTVTFGTPGQASSTHQGSAYLQAHPKRHIFPVHAGIMAA